MYLLKDASYFQKWWWVSVRELNRLLAAAIWGAAVLARQWVCSYSGMLGGKSTYNSVCKESLRCGKRNVQSSVGVWGGGIKPWEPWERIFFSVFFFPSKAVLKMHVPTVEEGRRENGWGDPPHGWTMVGLGCSMHWEGNIREDLFWRSQGFHSEEMKSEGCSKKPFSAPSLPPDFISSF